MAFTPLPNQPYVFNPEIPCFVEQSDYRYDILNNDTTQIGFSLTPCEGVEPNLFNTIQVSAGWTVDGQIYSSNGGSGNLNLIFDSNLNSELLWKVTLSIEELTAGSLLVSISGWGSYTIESNGLFEFYFSTATSTTSINITSQGFIGNILLENSGNINPVIEPVNTSNLVHLLDIDGNIVDTIPTVIYSNIALYNIDWNDYAPGCYSLAYIDGCTDFAGRFSGICNGLPTTNLNCWTNNGVGGWSFDDSFLFELDGDTGLGRLSNGTKLEAGYTYQITWEIVDLVAATGWMTYLKEDETTLIIDGPYSSLGIGVHTFSFTPVVDGYLQLQCGQGFGVGETLGEFKDIIVELTGPFNYEGVTPCVCIGSDSTCSIELSGCFADTFINEGVVLDNHFQPTLRLARSIDGDPVAKLFKKQYITDQIKYRSSLGKNQLNFFDVQNSYILRIEQQPEFIFDFIFKMWAGFDNMLINGQAYRFNSDQFPVIDWSDKTGLGSVDIEVLPFQERTRKVLCGFRNQPCDPISPTNLIGMLYEDGVGRLLEDGEGMVYNLGE
jgi:hypothetical protein